MINRKTLEFYLVPKLGEMKYTHQGLKANCPKCDEGSKFNLEINMDKNIFNCWACRYSGFMSMLLEDYACDTTWEKLPEFKKTNIDFITEDKDLNYPKSISPFYLNEEATKYLIDVRGMNRLDLIKRGVSYVYSDSEMYFNHICFPFYENGRMVGACLQNLSNKRYRNLGKLNFVPYKEFINTSYPVVITEGVYDALSGVNAIPLLRTEVNKQILEFIKDKNVILAVDNTVEITQYTSLMNSIDKAQAKSLVLFDMKEYKDMNEYALKNKKGFINELKACFKKSKINE